MTKPKGLLIASPEALKEVYNDDHLTAIRQLLDIVAEPQTAASIKENPAHLKEVEVIMSTWGAPLMDEAFLKQAPNLKAVFYAAGSLRAFTTEAFWQRSITVSSAYALNAVAVAEYTLATILLSLKSFWHYSKLLRDIRSFPKKKPLAGAYGSTVGLISLGSIGRAVLTHLQRHDLKIIAYDPFLSQEEAQDLAVTMVSLEAIFKESDVVSLHTPALEVTRKMIKKAHFASMKEGATFINTARGMVIDEAALIEVMQDRPDLYAILDVTDPVEPPISESLLYDLPNVLLTPHIAGVTAKERERLGQAMLEELQRYVANMPLIWSISQEQAERMA